MLQDYRYVRPHDAACKTCAPTGGGHPLCQAPGCDGIAVAQTRRHASQAEYDALPEVWKPIDAVAHLVVFACDEHAEATAPFCEHADSGPVPCPTCNAEGEAPCTSTNGSPRTLRHRARWDAQPVPQPCMHAHREDCTVFEGCQCSEQDPNPPREPRIPPTREQIDGSLSKLPLPLVKPLVDAHDVPWWTVRTVATELTQDNKPAVSVVYATLDEHGNLVHDEHGHEVTDTLTIVLDPAIAPQPRRQLT